MGKLATYSTASFGALAAVVAHAFINNGQFYSSMVVLSQSRLFNALVCNTFMVLVMLGFELLRYVFLGNLRDQEVEKLSANTAFFLMETFITLTVFSTRYTIHTVALFVLCIFWKSFHWLAESRLAFLEQTPALGSSQLRLTLLLAVLLIGDSMAGRAFANHLLNQGVSERLLLLEEYLVMAVMAVTALLRLLLHLIDAKRNRRWESKGAARFYLEIVSDLMHCIIYITFFFLIYANYGLPINLVREMFVTIRNLYRTVNNFINYRRLAANLDTKFPNATEADLADDPTCSICFDDMSPGEAKKLNCGHMFHRHCLRQWLERQTTCPYCRQSIDTPVVRDAAEAREAAAAAAAVNADNNVVVEEGNGNGGVNVPGEGNGAAPFPAATPVPSATISEAEVESAFRLYETMFNVATPSPIPTSAAFHPSPTPTLEEAKVYADFHAEMHKAYEKLRERLQEQVDQNDSRTAEEQPGEGGV